MTRQQKIVIWYGVGLLAATVLRLVWASIVPMAADEVYYWDWTRAPQLSYLDHPPMVAWLGGLSGRVAQGSLGARAFVPLVFFAAGWFHYLSMSLLKRESGDELTGRDGAWLLFLMMGVPVFAYSGFVLLPDAGLYAASSVALWASLRCVKRDSLRWADGVLLGVALGLMGVSKYHALPLGAGLGLAIVVLRRPLLKREWRFYGAVIAAGIVVTLPVWIWNAMNDWASFRFQGSHGFEGLSVNFLAACQTWVGQIIMLSPVVLIAALVWAAVAVERMRAGLIPMLFLVPWLAFVPLFLMVELVTPFKQTLPHWVMPAFWMLIPVLAIDAGRRTTRAWRINAWIFGVLVTVLPFVIGSESVRSQVVKLTNGHPGALGEVTVWPDLVQQVQADAWYQDIVEATKKAPPYCPRPLVLASLRWFWTAQMAFLMPGQPRIFDLDPERPTYYRWRDRDVKLTGCPVLIVGDRRHWYPEKIAPRVTFESEKDIVIKGYEDLPTMMVRGKFL